MSYQQYSSSFNQQMGSYNYNNNDNQRANPNVDFFSLTPPEYEAQNFVTDIIDEAENACLIFMNRKEQIEKLIKTLLIYSETYDRNNNNNNNDALSREFQETINNVQQETTNLIINKRIKETKVIDNFLSLSSSFVETNIKQILQIKAKYEAIGVLNLAPEEYLCWLNIIKESQQKLNIITSYSNILQNTLTYIQEYERKVSTQQIKVALDLFEVKAIKFIQDFQLSNY